MVDLERTDDAAFAAAGLVIFPTGDEFLFLGPLFVAMNYSLFVEMDRERAHGIWKT